MATTTNYGWATPDDTALVKDGASAIRTLGSSIDTTTKALNPETTLGDIVYRSSTANVKTRLGIGSTGQVLTVAGGVPTWASAAGGGGKILQVVTATTNSQTNVGTTNYVDVTGVTATITCSANTSRVLVMISCPIFNQTTGGGTDISTAARISRNGTTILTNYNAQVMAIAPGPVSAFNSSRLTTFHYVDSPASTSALTYTLSGFGVQGNATYFNIAPSSSVSTAVITLMEIGA
jgi:hypothetical protein